MRTFYSRLAFQKIWPGTWWFEKPGVVMVMRGGYDGRREKGVTDVEWFVRQKRAWRRFREHVEQVAWTRTETVRTLRLAGFQRIHSTDALDFFRGYPGLRSGYRTFYLAQKRFNEALTQRTAS